MRSPFRGWGFEVFVVVAAILVALAIGLTSCTTEQYQRSARAVHLTVGSGNGSISDRGGGKAGGEVSRYASDGNFDTSYAEITLDVGAALFPDPDVYAMRLALERALRARDAELPQWVELPPPAPNTETSTVAPKKSKCTCLPCGCGKD